MKGTRELRRRFPGLPPIRVASGTHSGRTFNALNKMLSDLRDAGRIDYLRMVADKAIAPLVLLDHVRGKPYLELPPPNNVLPLAQQVTSWQATRQGDVSDEQRANDRWAWKRLLSRVSPAATLESVVELIRDERKKCKVSGQYAAFNHIRAAVLAFLRDTQTVRSRVYLDVLDVKVLPKHAKREGQPLTPREALELASALSEPSREAWVTMCLTGMDPGELWGHWELEDGHLHIHGTKRRGRKRLVPRIGMLRYPISGLTPKIFAAALKKVSIGRVQPRDGRRTYAKWLALAGVAPIHQDAYMGHGPKTMTELYQRGNEKPYLDADAARVREWLIAELACCGLDPVVSEMLSGAASGSEHPGVVLEPTPRAAATLIAVERDA